MFNRGSFKGASLDKFTGKQHSGAYIKEWYEKEDYRIIESYIENEADSFLKLYQFLVKRLPDIWREFAEEYNLLTSWLINHNTSIYSFSRLFQSNLDLARTTKEKIKRFKNELQFSQ